MIGIRLAVAKTTDDGNENVRNSGIHPTRGRIVTHSGSADRLSALSQAIDRLAIIARYERRTLSQRKLAIRQLDEILQRDNRDARHSSSSAR